MYPVGKNILVVDNEPERRGLIAQVLADEGFAVTAVGEGLAGLRALAEQRFSLAVAAIRLPGTFDGLSFIRQARARQPWLRGLLTGGYEARLPPHNPDRDNFIAAPFYRHELLGCVFELLERDTAPGAADLTRRCRVAACA